MNSGARMADETQSFEQYLVQMNATSLKPEPITVADFKAMAYGGNFTVKDYFDSHIPDAEALDNEVRHKLKLFKARIPKEIFDRLIFSYLIGPDAEKALVVDGRTTKRFLETMRNQSLTEKDLFQGGRFYDKWIDRVEQYYDDFEYDKFSPLILVMPTAGEKHGDESGLLYISDGNHRALALALKSRNDDFSYEPISSVIVWGDRQGLRDRGVSI